MKKHTVAALMAMWGVFTCAWGSVTETEQHVKISRLPLLIRHDARVFYDTMGDELNVKSTNPYEVYVTALLFGRVFGVLDDGVDVEEKLKSALSRLLTEDDARERRSHLLDAGGIEIVAGNTWAQTTLATLTQHRKQFQRGTEQNIQTLIKEKNVFALFMHGLLEYESGVLEGDKERKAEGVAHVKAAAEGFCEPALRMYGTLFPKHQVIAKGKIVTLHDFTSLNLTENLSAMVCNSVLAPTFYQGNEDKSLAPIVIDKVVEAAFRVPGFDQAFYKGVVKHLVKTTGAMRRGAATTVANNLWKVTAIGGPLVGCVSSAYQVIYAASTAPVAVGTNGTNVMHANATNSTVTDAADTAMLNAQIAASALVVLKYTGIPTLASSFVSGMVSSIALYKAPRFIKADSQQLDQECKLVALVKAAAHGGADVDEVVAEAIINDKWVTDKTVWWGTQKTLSQVALEL